MSLMDYPNHQSESFIEYHASQSPQAIDTALQVKQKAFQAMNELDGWCETRKASILIDYVLTLKPKIIIEIGVYGGKSLIPMAFALQANGVGKAFGIDPWSNLESIQGMDEANKNWWYSLDHQLILNTLVAKINKFGLQSYIHLIRSTSKDAAPIYDIDMIHIDGNHSEEASFFDVTKWVPLVKSGGVIILDDVTWAINGKFSQSKSVEWLDKNCIKQAQFRDGSDWAIWIKP